MKLKHIAALPIAVLAFSFASCSDFTDIDAKGNNLLKTTNDLELLLNVETDSYDLGLSFDSRGWEEACGSYFYSYSYLANSVIVTQPSASSIKRTWDESLWTTRLPELAASDAIYTSCYLMVGRVANPILEMVDAAQGTQEKRNQLKSEAYLIRAYFHYIVVQKFAPAYNPATAGDIIALPYMKEGQDLMTPQAPVSLQQYYDNILSDLEECDKAGGLLRNPDNRMRFGKGAYHAVKAQVLLSMGKYAEAASEADDALAIDNTLVDYNQSKVVQMVSTSQSPTPLPFEVFGRPRKTFAEDYYTSADFNYYSCLTPYVQQWIEPDHAYANFLFTTLIGKTDEEKAVESETRTGEPGYIVTGSDFESWFGAIRLGTSHMYLVKAEAALHAGDIDKAMGFVDEIRKYRLVTGTYTPLQGVVTEKAEAIKRYKMTVKTEYLFSQWNFFYMKRWTQLGSDWAETIERTLCGINMKLTPESKCWTFPIPQNVCVNNPNLKPFLN